MIDEEEKARFRKEKLPQYEEYVSETIEANKNYNEVAKSKRMKRIKELKTELSINLEKIEHYKKEIEKINKANNRLALLIKREENSLYMYCNKN